MDLFIEPFEGFRVFFGESELEIPENLFDLGIPAALGSIYCEYPEFNFFYDRLYGSSFDFFIKFIFDSVEEIFDKYKKYFAEENFLAENVSKFLNDSEVYISGHNREILSSGLARRFGGIDGQPLYNTSINSNTVGFPLNSVREFEKGLVYPQLNCGNLMKLIDISQLFFPKNTNLFEFTPAFFLDRQNIFGSIEMDCAAGSDCTRLRINNPPKNIFIAAASSELRENDDYNSKKKECEVARGLALSGLNKRVSALEEMFFNERMVSMVDYESVVRRLDIELRSALDSCCEGVHF